MTRFVYLTAELKARDLESRLWIAAHLVKAGATVLVGHQWGLFANAQNLSRGAYLFKTANRIQADNMTYCANAGHAVVVTDEEATAIAEDRLLYAVDPNALQIASAFLAQSEAHRNALLALKPRCEVKTVGSVRADLLRSGATFDHA